jgi:hypothetical protein
METTMKTEMKVENIQEDVGSMKQNMVDAKVSYHR